MTFRCDVKHFEETIKDTWEDLFLLNYLWVWGNVQFLSLIGIFIPAFAALSRSYRDDWNSKIVVYQSNANYQFAWYKAFEVIGLQWIICDPIMLKYWLVHAINFFVPDLDPFANLAVPKQEDGGIVIDIPQIGSIFGLGSD